MFKNFVVIFVEDVLSKWVDIRGEVHCFVFLPLLPLLREGCLLIGGFEQEREQRGENREEQ
jgi:hypothetical protein